MATLTNSDKQFWKEFILLYRELTCLWKMDSEEYLDKGKRVKAYRVMLDKLKEKDPTATKETVSKKINNFRTAYNKELRKVKKARSEENSDDEPYVPQLWYFDLMHFVSEQHADNSDGVELDPNMFEEIPGLPVSTHRQQKYRRAWEDRPEFRSWLEAVDGDPFKARCRLCNNTMTAELTVIKNHSKGKKHCGYLVDAACSDITTDEGKMTVNTAGIGPVHVEWKTLQESFEDGMDSTPASKRHRLSFDDSRKQKLLEKAERCLDQVDDDEYDVFGRFVAVKLRKMQKTQSHFAEKQILEIIYNCEMMEYSQQYNNDSD